jgi:hypothetical protein
MLRLRHHVVVDDRHRDAVGHHLVRQLLAYLIYRERMMEQMIRLGVE